MNPHSLETVRYINNNSILFHDFMIAFNDGFDYSYYDMTKNQLVTVVNRKNEIENLLATTKFNRNKTRLILALEDIEIHERILFEYNRLIKITDKDNFNELEKVIAERKIALDNVREKLDMLDEYKTANFAIAGDTNDEFRNMVNEIEQILNDDAKIKILIANIAVNNDAMGEINLLISKLRAVTNKLIENEQEIMNYLEWRMKIPF